MMNDGTSHTDEVRGCKKEQGLVFMRRHLLVAQTKRLIQTCEIRKKQRYITNLSNKLRNQLELPNRMVSNVVQLPCRCRI